MLFSEKTEEREGKAGEEKERGRGKREREAREGERDICISLSSSMYRPGSNNGYNNQLPTDVVNTTASAGCSKKSSSQVNNLDCNKTGVKYTQQQGRTHT